MLRKPVALVLVLVVLLSLPIGSALAQGGELPPVFCGGLSADDCAILEQSQLAMMEVSSSALSMQMDMTMVGMDDSADSFSMSLLVDGAFAVDPELMASFAHSPSPEAISEMMTEGMAVAAEMLTGVQGEASLELVLPAELAAEAGIPMDTLATELKMVDGVVYANLEMLIPAEAMEGGEMQMPAWMGLDLAGMYEVMGDMPMDEFDGDMAEMQEFFASEELAALYDYESWGDFVIVTRLDDAEVDGQPMAVFNIVVDYQALFGSEAFVEAFTNYMDKIMEMQGEEAEELPDNFMEVIQAMMSGMSVEVNQWVGLEDSYIHHFDMDFAFEIDPEVIAEIDAEAAAEMPENFSMSMSIVADSSAFNEPVEVVAPEGAQVINPAMFMQMETSTAS